MRTTLLTHHQSSSMIDPPLPYLPESINPCGASLKEAIEKMQDVLPKTRGWRAQSLQTNHALL
jgi:hypothetical protein